MSKLWGQMLLVPSVVRLTSRAPKDPSAAWDGYWRGIRTTGRSGDVLWDSGSQTELEQYTDAVLGHFNPALPVIDVGCGNGTNTRWLAGLFPRAIGIDVSVGAIALARREAAGLHNVEFLAMDATEPDAGEHLLESVGPANVFVRGVFHVLKPDQQASLATNLRTVVGNTGRVFLAETNFPGSSLAYLQELGATRRRMPRQLQRALENLPRPGHFGMQERHNTFPDSDWHLIADGPAHIEVTPMNANGQSQHVPGYFALLAGA